MNKSKVIGIVGGVGPHAGIDLCKKILEQTKAYTDQDHLSVAMLSLPREICDRTAFILGETSINPAFAIVEVIKKLEVVGAEVVAIACNTSHAPEIYDVICSELDRCRIHIKLLNIINEVINYIRFYYPDIHNIGVMSTMGGYKAKVYENALKVAGLNAVIPDECVQENVIHKAVYDHEYGIKAKSDPVDNRVREQLIEGIEHLMRKGADAVILGCTEMSLAITEDFINDVIVIDSTRVLAGALVKEALVEV